MIEKLLRPLFAVAFITLICPCVHAAFEPIPPRTQQRIPLRATEPCTMLFLEGRLASSVEAAPESSIRLYLNGVLLDGSRIIGRKTVLTPENPKLTTPPYPRYSAEDHYFAFPKDTDFIAGNGPFFNESAARTVGCPYLLQLNVGDILHSTGNELLIINGNRKAFIIKQCSLQRKPEPVDEPLFVNSAWPFFYWSAEMRTRYREALGKGTFTPEEKASILTGLGTAEFLREGGDRAQAVHDWQQALTTSSAFNLRGEAAYRLAAERLHTGQWVDGHTEALVRAAAKGDDSWAELAAVILTVSDRRPDAESPRLIIRPPLMHGPQQVDGVLDEPFWKTVKVYPLLNPMKSYQSDRTLPYYNTDVRFVVLPDGIALGFTGKLPENVHWLTGRGRDEPVWEDNAVEFFVSPGTDLRHYYELDATPLGGQFDARNEWWWKTDSTWNGAWQVAARLDGTQFTIEYFVPWTDLGLKDKPASGTAFVVAVTRYLVRDTGMDYNGGMFYTLTKHRAYDCHRLMDGAVLVIP